MLIKEGEYSDLTYFGRFVGVFLLGIFLDTSC